MKPRIALLNASYDPDNTRRNFRRELDANLVEYHTPSGEMPETFGFDACVVTGSRASVYWEEPWIAELKRWVEEAVGREMPTLGVCFGHQLLADVLGGAVEDMGEYELGYRRASRPAGTTLLAGLDREFTAFMTHSDRVSRLPPGARLLAVNDCGIQGFRKGPVFGVQFHPEYDMETARQVTRGKDSVNGDRIEGVLADIENSYGAACETKAMFDNFTGYVRDRRESGRISAD